MKVMKIEVKTITATKSKILQMNYLKFPKGDNYDVLGWVNLNKDRFVITKINNEYFRCEFILELDKSIGNIQVSDRNGGWSYPMLTSIKCVTYNHKSGIVHSPSEVENDNLKKYDRLASFKRKTEIAGQIYY